MTQIASLLGGGQKQGGTPRSTPALFRPKPSEETTEKLGKVRKKLKPETIKKAIGKPISNKTVDKLSGKKDSNKSVKPISTSNKKVGNVDPNVTNISEDRSQRMRRGDSVADVLAKIVNFYKKSHADIVKQKEITNDFKKEEHEKEKRKHEELLRLLRGESKEAGATPLEKVSNIGAEENPELAARVARTNSRRNSVTTTPTERNVSPQSKGVSNVFGTAGSLTFKTAKPSSSFFSSLLSIFKNPFVAAAGGAAAGAAATGAGADASAGALDFRTIAALKGSTSDAIAAEEGQSTKASWDPPEQRNLVSIGYGHQIQKEEYKQGFIMAGDEKVPIQGERGIGTVMTPEQTKKLLSLDLPKYEAAAAKPLGDAWNKLDDKQKTALVLYAYSTGSTADLVKKGLVEAINKGDVQGAANIIKNLGIRTAAGVPGVYGPLVKRREREAILFATGKLKTTSEATSTTTAPTTAAPSATPTTPDATTGQKLNKSSTENSDMKKDSETKSMVAVNNTKIVNNTTTTKFVNITQKPAASDVPQILQNRINYVQGNQL